MTPIEITALETVEEMRALGTIFEIERVEDGRSTFVWRARPASLRDAVRAYWESVPKATGLKEAMARVVTFQAKGDVL